MKGKGEGRGWEEEKEEEEEKKKRHVAHSTTLHKGVLFYSRGKLAGEQVNERQIFFFFFFYFLYKSNYSSFYPPVSQEQPKSNGDKYDNSHGSNDL